jgi:DNA-binding NarL/FixJ family response regulator
MENSNGILKVIVIDDSPVIVDRLQKILDDVSCAEIAGIASTIEAGFQLIQEQRPHVVIMEIHVGRKTSNTTIGLLHLVKKVYPEMKVIMFTNMTDLRYRDTCFAFGADYFFDKSNDADRIPVVLSDLCSILLT